MKDLRKLKKAELMKILVDEYGYEKEDLKRKVKSEH
ncbi:glycogen/starch/alpha-glucan phosphorylase [Bacillus cereus]|nr:glycogen/starch/alpha-glucan phosphorylase [Bacillus cereus]